MGTGPDSQQNQADGGNRGVSVTRMRIPRNRKSEARVTAQSTPRSTSSLWAHVSGLTGRGEGGSRPLPTPPSREPRPWLRLEGSLELGSAERWCLVASGQWCCGAAEAQAARIKNILAFIFLDFFFLDSCKAKAIVRRNADVCDRFRKTVGGRMGEKFWKTLVGRRVQGGVSIPNISLFLKLYYWYNDFYFVPIILCQKQY